MGFYDLRSRWIVDSVTAAIMFMLACPVRCDEMDFDANSSTTYSWTDTTRWTIGGSPAGRVPTINDNVTISLGGANRTITMDGDAACGNLTVYAASGARTLTINPGTVNPSTLTLGGSQIVRSNSVSGVTFSGATVGDGLTYTLRTDGMTYPTGYTVTTIQNLNPNQYHDLTVTDPFLVNGTACQFMLVGGTMTGAFVQRNGESAAVWTLYDGSTTRDISWNASFTEGQTPGDSVSLLFNHASNDRIQTLKKNSAFSGGITVQRGILTADAGLSTPFGSGNVTVDPSASAGVATLQLKGAYIDDAATVNINSNGTAWGTIDIAAGVTNEIAALCFHGVKQDAGTWGSSASGADNPDNTRFSGLGVLSVPHPAGTLFRFR